MYQLFIIFFLTLTTIIFATLFIIYYNNIDRYMRNKEHELFNREKEILKKEELIKKYEICNSELITIKNKITKIKELLK